MGSPANDTELKHGGASAFLSYSRKDSEYAERIEQALSSRGFKVRKDTNDILPAEDWKDRLRALIGNSDATVILVSQNSVKSEVCAWEFEYAESLNKRIIPVAMETLPSDQIPARIGRLNFVSCTPDISFDRAVDSLERALVLDINWVREHTRLFGLASRAISTAMRSDTLLRGQDLNEAESWRDSRPSEAPIVTKAHNDFISFSRRVATKRQRNWAIGSAVVTAFSIALATYAYFQSVEAIASANRALRTESNFLSRASSDLLNEGAISDALALAWLALPHDEDFSERPWVPEAEVALRRAMSWNKEIRVFGSNGEGVNSVDVSSDGKFLATSSSSNGVSVWSMVDGQRIMQFEGHEGEVFNAIFSADGASVLSSGTGTVARLWSVQTGEEIAQFKGHENGVDHVVFNPDESLVATGSSDGTIRLWDSQSGEQIHRMDNGNSHWVTDLAFSPDGSLLAAGGIDNAARLWSVPDGRLIATLGGHSHFVWDIDFNHQGDLVATGSTDGTVRIWQTDGSLERTLEGHDGGVLGVDFTPDGEHVLTVSEDFTGGIWNLNTGLRVGSLIGHKDRVQVIQSDSTGDRYFTSSSDGTVIIWRASDYLPASIIGRHEVNPPSFTLSPDEKYLLTGTRGGRGRLWSTSYGNGVLDLDAPEEQISTFAIHQDEHLVVSGYESGQIKLWDLNSGELLRTYLGGGGPVNNVTISSDGRSIAAVTEYHAVRIWNVADDNSVFVRAEYPGARDVKFLDQGAEFLTISQDNVLRRRSSLDGAILSTLEIPVASLDSIKLSPTGETALIWSRGENSAHLITVPDLSNLFTLEGHSDYISSVAFSPDGNSIVTGSWDHTARIWNVADGQEKSVLRGHTAMVTSIDVSPDGSQILTGSLDYTAKIWNAADGTEVATLADHDQNINSVDFHPDGGVVLTGADDGQIVLWKISGGTPVMRLYWDWSEVDIENAQFSVDGARVVASAKYIVEAESNLRVWRGWPEITDLIAESSKIVENLAPLNNTDMCRYFQSDCTSQ